MNFSPSIHKGIVDHPDFSIIANNIIKHTGLAYYGHHLEDLAQSVSLRMSRVNIQTLTDYAVLLDDNEHACSEIDELAKLLTIGETHFFRHQNLMDALRRDVLPDLIKQRSKTKQLRIWSAGCSIGPEPYTLAIILRKYFGKKISDWNISILGTDINRDFLEQAVQGRYSEWALRGLDEELLWSCFNYDGSHWNINDTYKRDVHFQYHNLTTDLPPVVSEHDGGFDLILCRNVFIYFDPTTIQQVASRFREYLVDKGYLAIGHSEMNITQFSDYAHDSRSNAPVYQKVKTESHCRDFIPFKISAQKVQQSRSSPIEHLHNSKNEQNTLTTDRLADVDHCANAGYLDQAVELCRNVILRHRLDPNAHLRQAMLLQEQGFLDKAEDAVRHAVYLDRSSPLAHYLYGTIRQQQGNHNDASKSFRTVMDLLEPRDNSSIIDKKSGMTAGDLLRIVTVHMHEDSSI